MPIYSQSSISSILSDLGRSIRRRRRQLQLTQSELAGLSGVGTRFISELESGKPGLEIGRAIVVIENIGLRLIVEEREKLTPPKPNAEFP